MNEEPFKPDESEPETHYEPMADLPPESMPEPANPEPEPVPEPSSAPEPVSSRAPEPDPVPEPISDPAPAPESSPDPERNSESEPDANHPHHSRPDSPKRRLVTALVLLYAVSMGASGWLVWQSKRKAAAEEAGGDSAVEISKKFLAAAMSEDYVGLVNISGPIYAGSGSGWGAGMSGWRRRMEKLAKKKEVKGLVLWINSPGGSVGAVQELYSTINRIRKEHKKPIVASFGDVAASGGYYLAAACDKIVSQPGTLLGSIGVIFNSTNVEGLLGKVGLKSRTIKSGRFKDIGSATRPMSAEEKKILQALIDNAYDQFLGAVVAGRKMPESKIRPLADGRVYTGEQALELGLVDKLGSLHDAVMLAGQIAGIEGKPKVMRDTDSFSTMLELLDSKASVLRSFSYSGLEYRWRQ